MPVPRCLAPSEQPSTEFAAYGAPSICDAISHVAQFVVQLKKTNLCDKVDIYLSGCNTAGTAFI